MHKERISGAARVLITATLILASCKGVEGRGENTECEGGTRVNSSESNPGFNLIDKNKIILRNCFPPPGILLLLSCWERAYESESPISVNTWTEADAVGPLINRGISVTHAFPAVDLKDSIRVCKTSHGDIFTRSGEGK